MRPFVLIRKGKVHRIPRVEDVYNRIEVVIISYAYHSPTSEECSMGFMIVLKYIRIQKSGTVVRQ